MKLIKAMKKLKFWSTKKNKAKKRNNYYKIYQHYQPSYYPTPPPPLLPLRVSSIEGAAHHCQCHFCKPVEPSAPPLPPWIESQLLTTQDEISGTKWVDPVPHSGIDQSISSQKTGTEGSSSTYQQYLVEKPVYEVSYVTRPHKKAYTTKGLLGCALNFGSFLIRCICPCFRISEPL